MQTLLPHSVLKTRHTYRQRRERVGPATDGLWTWKEGPIQATKVREELTEAEGGDAPRKIQERILGKGGGGTGAEDKACSEAICSPADRGPAGGTWAAEGGV